MSKKFLLITYYWPPVAGGGVHRWMKMSKYFGDFGWEPIVYTPIPSEFTVKDESLLKELLPNIETIKTPIWEPYGLYRKFIGTKKGDKFYSGFIEEKGKTSLTKKISLFLRGNFFIPDARRFWIQPSVNHLKKYLEANPVDYIISTGPPHSMHMIALGLKEHFPNLKWIADFRDPWTNINFYDKLKVSSWADKRQKKMEQKVLQAADKIVTVSWSWAEDFKKLSKRNDIEVITNGYDEANFVHHSKVNESKKFTLIHIGSMNPDRNPHVLWQALKTMLEHVPELKEVLEIKLIGVVDFQIIQSIESFGLTPYLNRIEFLPHQEAINHLCNAEVLILPINTTRDAMGVLPGKLYEYLGARKPILCICLEGSDAEKIILDAKAGHVVHYQESEKALNAVHAWYEDFKNGNQSYVSDDFSKYSRRNLAGTFAKLLESL